ncbi:TetR/AcrR family transcriptional regulator [Antrihabitans sp. YC2-6]|nr:TetR/AcrR family transcriptional regulator [Antrihabitans sp. YC2-6]
MLRQNANPVSEDHTVKNGQLDWLAGGNRRDLAIERIFTVARELVIANGLDAISVDEIAERAGCSRATLYRYVGGKPAIRDGVVARAAAGIVAQVQSETAAVDGPDRVVGAIMASVAAVRADPVASTLLGRARSNRVDRYFSTSTYLEQTAAALTGLTDDRFAAQWIVRIVLSLLVWPGESTAAERSMVERYVAPGFVRP